MISDWGKVVSNLKWIIKAYESPYFDLLGYCNDHNLNYRDIVGFMTVGKMILNGEIDLSKDLKGELKNYERLIKQLGMITL